jgi:tetratricopeptide (TPR) repeat protein
MKQLMTTMTITAIALLCIATGCAADRAARTAGHEQQHPAAHAQPPQHPHTTPAAAKAAAKGWGAGLGDHHHPVSTNSAAAQRAFDEGLILVYAFNHDEAIRAFERALEHDPKLAMAHWGIALALGPNYNMDVTPENEKLAYAAIQRARELAKDAPQHEKDYIDALAIRYTNDPNPDLPKLAKHYAAAMRALSQKYPDDLDAATLYADAMMVLRPWKLWTKDGRPEEGTEEIVATLEYVMARNPDHPGANHLYIHAVEASNHPEWALEAAGRLPGLAPAAGHLVHMPSHIYQRVGDYEAAANSNVSAVEADEEYIRAMKPKDGMYNMMYYPHNIHFLAAARAMEGRDKEAIAAARKLVKYVAPHVPHMPMLEGFMPTDLVVLARGARWDEILRAPEPTRSMPTTHALWHFARGMAYVAKDQPDRAQHEYEQLVAETKGIPSEAPFSMFNGAHSVLSIADDVLAARIAVARNDVDRGVKLLYSAAKKETALNYTEPPDWLLPCHEMLGGVLLRVGREAEAEKVFRTDLKYNPRSGRSLFGLSEALKAQGKHHEARLVELQFKDSWNRADKKLRLEDL